MTIDIQSIWNNAVAQTQALNPERLRVNYDDVNAAPADRQMQAIQANTQENPNAIKAQFVLNAADVNVKNLVYSMNKTNRRYCITFSWTY